MGVLGVHKGRSPLCYFYKKRGYVWFWTGTVGTNLSGYYRINPQGKTLDEMFTFISKEWNSSVEKVPLNERAYFWEGDKPLSMDVWRSGVDGWRLDVDGLGRLDVVAPVVVVKPSQVEQTGVLETATQTSKQLQSAVKAVLASAGKATDVVARLETAAELGFASKKDVAILKALLRDASNLQELA